jgi:transcriptional regulator with XRE-family HTH domain
MSTVIRFGNFFRQRRQTLGLSLREFCRRNGFDPGNISRLERGLLTPPHSTEVLESYAKALKLELGSREWNTLVDLAAIETGRIPHQIADNQAVLDKLPQTFRTWRNQRTRSGPWTKATDLELWANYQDARERLPQLVRRLIRATVDSIQHIGFPAEEGVQRLGWDGIVETISGNEFVPSGLSVWEMGVGDPEKKAEDDFRKRAKNPLGLDPSQMCFVFVTLRKWLKKVEWRDKKRKLAIWKDVRVYDSVNLEEWLETAPAVDAWMARLLGRRPDGVIDIEEHWANLSSLAQPSLVPEVFLASREKEIERLKEWLKGSPSSLAFEASSPTEVIDFLAAYAASLDDSERDRIESRIVIVERAEAWHMLCTSKNSLLLIPRPNLSIEAEMVAEAVRQGHYVLLCSHRFASERTSKQELSRPYRYELEKALVSSGINEEKASRLAREVGGSLTVLKRRLSHFPSTRQPEWSQPQNAPDLVPILLAGGWDDANAGDRAIIAELAGRSYDEVSSIATRWLASEDSLLIRLLTHWSLISREDSWLLLAPYITRQQLDIFEEVAGEVLSEEDPRYNLPPNERWRAGLHDKLPKYSGQLCTGIAETLALLGAKSDSGLIQESIEPARRVERVVRQLLTKSTTWKRWASLGSLLPVLAEAAPEAFLNAVEADLRSQEPQLPKLFADEGEPLFSSCTHAGLLWALEMLAWESSLLTRVSLALAHLARIDPGGRWANRPITSLQEIFLPWFPQTTASVEQRIKVLQTLADKVPDIGWRLLLDLLPTLHGISMPTSRPHWRDWALNWSKEVTNAEYWRQVEACADLLIDLVGTDPERWVQAIENFENFPMLAQDRLICRLRKFDIETLDTIARKHITDELREKINKHRSFPDARWVLPTEKLDELEAIKKRFEPQDPIARHAWLFNMHPELVSDHEVSWQQREEKLFQLRQDALREILDSGGLQKVFELVGVADNPRAVGFALGKARLLETDSPILPLLLTSEKQKIKEFAVGYGQGRFAEASWRWIEHIGLSQWTPEQAGGFLAFVPGFERKAWEVVKQLGADVMPEYWRRVSAFYHNASTEDVEYAVSMFLKHNRPFQAVRVLDRALYDKHEVDSSLLLDTLEAGLKSLDQNYDSYEIQQLFKRLQSDPNVDIRRLAALEWAYFKLLNSHEASPETLHRLLRTEPRFFADLLRLLFRSDKEPEESTEVPTEEQKVHARNAYRLLMQWKSVPGLREDKTVDEQKLLEWVTEARRLCEESGRLVICDLRIGEVLAYAPKESDGTWPCLPVRDVIDEIDSEALTRGFEIGIFNRRGGFTKSPIEGGKQERELARKYASYAEACDIEWPMTAAALRRVAHQYEEDARREDEEAKERSLR